MGPHPYPYFHNYTTNDHYGAFYDSPRISLQTVPNRLKNDQLETKKTVIATTSSEYGGFMQVNPSQPPRWYVMPDYMRNRPGPSRLGDGSYVPAEPPLPPSQLAGHLGSNSPRVHLSPPPKHAPEDAVIRYNDRHIRLPEVDAVELHMKDKSKILLSVKEFYRRYLDQ